MKIFWHKHWKLYSWDPSYMKFWTRNGMSAESGAPLPSGSIMEIKGQLSQDVHLRSWTLAFRNEGHGDGSIILLSLWDRLLIPQTGDSLLTWLLSGLLGWIMFQFSKRVYLLERAFSLISWLRVFRFCPVNHVAGVKLCQPLFLWGCMAFKGFDFHSDWSLNLFSSSLMLIDQSV